MYLAAQPAPGALVYHNVPHCPPQRESSVQDDLSVGIDAKVTFVLFSWLGLTAGYRMPFTDPFGGAAILGVSAVMAPTQVPAARG